jgi:hypothetical protein
VARHAGVDLRAADGAPVRAVAAGVVRRAGALGGYGEAVEIDHGGGVTTLYGHASRLLVHEGEAVSQGQEVARVGHSGRATGTHLHFEGRQDGKPMDPGSFLQGVGPPTELASPLLHSPAGAARAALPSTAAARATTALKIYGRRDEVFSESGS